MNMKPAERDNTDSRIRFAMAIDPAPVDVFRIDSFSRIRIPMEIVNLGRPASIPPTALALEVAKLIPSGVYSTIKDASHFSMFGECKPGAAEMARAEDIEEPICSDGGGRPRREIQKEMVDLAVRAFDRHLKTKAR
jgi:predicted dienelactone hydrolase